jgi:uncharacterized phage protein (TIGR02220 family)
MSVKVMARVWVHSQRKDGELLVMLALADFANDAGECWPSIPTLAKKARLTDRQTRRVLNGLETAGEIRRSRSNGGRNRRNHYFITLSENPDNITLTKLQGKNNPVIGDTKTLTSMSGALNHHRTINKSGAIAPVQSTPQKRSARLTRSVGIPSELQPIVSRIVAKINALGGTRYGDDKPDALRQLLDRLSDGRSEGECLLVVEGRHAAWAGNYTMLEYFRPSTLFAKDHFDDYLQDAQRRGNGNAEDPEYRKRTFING